MLAVELEGCGVVEIAGSGATRFRHNLVTNDIAKLARAKLPFARCWRRKARY
jgi:folate-binding Fe-S cluster repair protein YgfZ